MQWAECGIADPPKSSPTSSPTDISFCEQCPDDDVQYYYLFVENVKPESGLVKADRIKALDKFPDSGALFKCESEPGPIFQYADANGLLASDGKILDGKILGALNLVDRYDIGVSVVENEVRALTINLPDGCWVVQDWQKLRASNDCCGCIAGTSYDTCDATAEFDFTDNAGYPTVDKLERVAILFAEW